MAIPEVDEAIARAFAERDRVRAAARGPHAPIVPAPPAIRRAGPALPDAVSLLQEQHAALLDGLAAQVEENLRANRYRVLLCTSSFRAEGRTTISLALARQLARLSGRTLLVDADLQAPALGKRLGADVRVGLDDVVAGRNVLAEALVPLGDSPLLVLPMRLSIDRPREFLSSPGWRCTIAKLRREYDRIVLDGGPLFAGVSAALFQRSVDAALLIHRRGALQERTMRHAVEILAGAGIPLLGLAENFA